MSQPDQSLDNLYKMSQHDAQSKYNDAIEAMRSVEYPMLKGCLAHSHSMQ